MFRSDQIRSVHLEVTDKCNASCPMCPRSDHGGPLNPYVKSLEMSLEDAKIIFPADFVQQLKFIQLCGSFGDPIMAKDTLEILKYFRECNPGIALGVHTNGSARPPQWWSELGKLLSGPKDYCKFGMDGLADTNALYRRKTSWDRIMASTQAFISAGGKAHWEYLVFRHNEHQVEEARALAEKMGFQFFFVKKTSRFFNYQNGKNEPYEIWDENRNVVGHLEPPQVEKFINPVSLFGRVETEPKKEPKAQPEAQKGLGPQMRDRITQAKAKAGQIFDKFKSLQDYYNKTEVSCMSLNEGSIYVSVEGDIFPCCFLGGQIGYIDRGPDGDRLAAMTEAVARKSQSHNAKKYPIRKIIDGFLFRDISDSWSKKEDQAIGTCKRTCGKNLQLVAGEYG